MVFILNLAQSAHTLHSGYFRKLMKPVWCLSTTSSRPSYKNLFYLAELMKIFYHNCELSKYNAEFVSVSLLLRAEQRTLLQIWNELHGNILTSAVLWGLRRGILNSQLVQLVTWCQIFVCNFRVLHNHIRKLQQIITPTHAALRISEEYLTEAPWPFAQQQISYISAYKTPREKLQCVVR